MKTCFQIKLLAFPQQNVFLDTLIFCAGRFSSLLRCTVTRAQAKVHDAHALCFVISFGKMGML